ncbi:MAG TPA: radical SAM family heme chaperone HemW [Nitrospiria bacterium]
MSQPLFLYLHFPYCWSKCHYCAFNSIRYDKPQSLRFLSALKMEIERCGRSPRVESRPLSTIYMGGGTPSIFSAEQILEVLDHCRDHFRFADNIEITVEANPGTVDFKKLAALNAGGINRLSLGVQSFQDPELVWLGRAHNAEAARAAIQTARAAGFANLNLDFIYALPGQRLEDWERTLREAVDLGPEHLSAYALTIEEGTRFGADFDNGLIVLPDEERQIRFDEFTWDLLEQAGYVRYEISNYAKAGAACRHNLSYWNQQDYLGLGPGAHSYLGGRRFSKIESIDRYIREVNEGGDAVDETDSIDSDLACREAVIFGLRKTEGICYDDILRRHPPSDAGDLREKFGELGREGLLVEDPSRLRLSPRGLQVWDRIAEGIL